MKIIIEKILRGKQITQVELNSFIEQYIEKKKDKVPTALEIQKVARMIRDRFFNIGFAAKEFALELGLTVITVEGAGVTSKIVNVYE